MKPPRCRHLSCTWDPRFPWRCAAWGIRSRGLPCREVQEASGFSCRLFEPVAPRGGPRRAPAEPPSVPTHP